MNRPAVLSIPALVLLAGCSGGSSRPAQSGNEREIAALEQHLGADSPAVDATTRAAEPITAAPAIAKLLSPGFESAALAARDSLMALSRAVESEAQFDAAVAAARGQVAAARSAVKTEHDRDAALVLTVLLAKQRELALLDLLRRRNPSLAPDPELEAGVKACSNELRSWVEGSTADAGSLQDGECLGAAHASIAAFTP